MLAAPAAAQAGLELYDLPDFRGERVLMGRATPDMGPDAFDDRTSSILVGFGAWELCSAPDYRGVCRVVTDNVRDLGALGLDNQISSIRPVANGVDAQPGPGPATEPALQQSPAPGPEQGGDRLEGFGAAFFPEPDIPSGRLGPCLAGAARACEDEVDRFCRSQAGGWFGGAYYSLDVRDRRLTDVLCIR